MLKRLQRKEARRQKAVLHRVVWHSSRSPGLSMAHGVPGVWGIGFRWWALLSLCALQLVRIYGISVPRLWCLLAAVPKWKTFLSAFQLWCIDKDCFETSFSCLAVTGWIDGRVQDPSYFPRLCHDSVCQSTTVR
jgi:hypothetical protein